MDDRKLSVARAIMRRKGINGKLDISNRKNKRFVITLNDGSKIHFGVWPYKKHGTYLDHGNDKIRQAWKARHKAILKDGKPAYLNKHSSEFYSWNLLW